MRTGRGQGRGGGGLCLAQLWVTHSSDCTSLWSRNWNRCFPQLLNPHGNQQLGALGWVPHRLGDMGLGGGDSTQREPGPGQSTMRLQMSRPRHSPDTLCGGGMVISSKGSPGSLTGSAPAQSPALDSAGITPWQCPAWDTGQGMLTHEPEPLHPSQTGAAQGLNPGMGNLPGREKPLSIPSAPAAAAQAPQAVPSSFQALALCDFPPGVGVAAVLRMGEQLRILAEDGEWWLVVSEVSGKECHVPSSCVAKIRHGWLYEGVSRQKAEELLLGPGNHSGSFLIRESQSRRGCYSLSLRRGDRGDRATVTHYRIQRLHNGWLYISPGLTFPSLHSLVEHYSEFGEGLCCPLGRPCCPLGWPCSTDGTDADAAPSTPAVGKKPSLQWDKIDSSLLLSEPAAPQEDSPFSLGLREAISSYLLLSDTHGPEPGTAGKGVRES